MMTQVKMVFGALSVMLLIGCNGGQVQPQSSDVLSADADTASGKEDSTRRKAHPELYSCQTDSDCVAVEKAGCCPNGFLVAVNQDEVKSYNTIYACQDESPVCPLFVVNDTRVAQCDFTTHSCQMIDPAQIRCGGFIAPAMQHHCPTGFDCHYTNVPDLPGTCVAQPSQTQSN